MVSEGVWGEGRKWGGKGLESLLHYILNSVTGQKTQHGISQVHAIKIANENLRSPVTGLGIPPKTPQSASWHLPWR